MTAVESLRGTAKRVAVVAEDDPSICALECDLLAMDGWEVHAVHSGVPVADLVDAVEPVLVLLDVMMPEVDGVEAMEECRRRGHGPDDGTVYIIVSALGDDPAMMRGVMSGADDYITKPFDVEDLVPRVERWCEATGWTLAAPDNPGTIHAHPG